MRRGSIKNGSADENYKAIAPWYILDNKEYVERMILVRNRIEEYLKKSGRGRETGE